MFADLRFDFFGDPASAIVEEPSVDGAELAPAAKPIAEAEIAF